MRILLVMSGLLVAGLTALGLTAVAIGMANGPDMLVFAGIRPDMTSAELFVLDTSRGQPLQLTHSRMLELEPEFAPDGDHIAYTSSYAPPKRVCIRGLMEPERCLELWGRWDSAPRWSPDGKSLLFLSPAATGGVDLVLADAASGAMRRLTTLWDARMQADWSPDGSRVVVFAADVVGASRLMLIDPADGSQTELLPPQQGPLVPLWSPDGAQIALIDADYRLLLLDLATGETQELPAERGAIAGAAWSPDGQTLVYAGSADGDFDLIALDIATGTSRRLTDSDADDFQPAWSADGRTLAFMMTTGINDVRLAWLDVETGQAGQYLLAGWNISAFSWRPD